MPQRLFHWAQTDPAMTSFVFVSNDKEVKRMRREYVFELAVRYAFYIKRLYKIKKGDIVCNTIPNSPERLFTDLGAVLAGAILLDGPRETNDHAKLKDEFFWLLEVTECKLVIIPERTLFPSGVLCMIWDQLPTVKIDWVVYEWETTVGKMPLVFRLQSLHEVHQLMQELPEILPQDNMVIWTAGKDLKLAYHNHNSVLGFAEQLDDFLLSSEPGDVFFNDYDLGTFFGFPYLYLLNGLTTVMEDRSYYPRDRSEIPRLQWSHYMQESCSKAFFRSATLKNYIPSNPKWKFNLIVLGGHVVPQKIVKAVLDKLTRALVIAYCTIEVGLIARNVLQTGFHKDYREGDAGSLIFEAKVKIMSEIDPENVAKEVKCGQIGRILVKKEDLIPFMRPDKVAHQPAAQTDWFDTSDIGFLDHNNELKLVGTAYTRVQINDKYFYPEILETLLRNLKKIDDAVVVAVIPNREQEDDARDQVMLVACLTLNRNVSPEEARLLCKHATRDLPEWETPEEYRIFHEFPTTSLGLVDRREILSQVRMDVATGALCDWRWQRAHRRNIMERQRRTETGALQTLCERCAQTCLIL